MKQNDIVALALATVVVGGLVVLRKKTTASSSANGGAVGVGFPGGSAQGQADTTPWWQRIWNEATGVQPQLQV